MKPSIAAIVTVFALASLQVGCGGTAKKSGSAQRDDTVPADAKFILRRAAERAYFDPALHSLKTDPNAEIRGRLADVLGEVGGSAAATLLRELLTDAEADVRSRAAFSTVQYAASPDAPRLRDTLIEQLSGAAGPEELVALVDALSAFSPLPNGDALTAPYTEHADPQVRATAATALGRMVLQSENDALSVERLSTLLEDPEAAVRTTAAWALSRRATAPLSDSLQKALTEALRRDTAPEVRIQAVRTLVQQRGFTDNAASVALADSDSRIFSAALAAARTLDAAARCDTVETAAAIAVNTPLTPLHAAALFDAAHGCSGGALAQIAETWTSGAAETTAAPESVYAGCAAQFLLGAGDIAILGCDGGRPRLGKLRLIERLENAPENPTSRETLNTFLADADPAVALAALHAAAAYDDASAVQTVKSALKSDNPLLQIGALLDAAEHSNRYVTETDAGVRVLADDFRESLRALYERHAEFDHAFMPLRVAVDAVGALNVSDLTPLATKLLHDTRLPVRSAAIEAFSKMSGFSMPVALPPTVVPTETRRALTTMDQDAEWTAVLQFERGDATVVLDAEAARMIVGGFVHAARSAYYDGSAVGRAVPGETITLGDPTGTGFGDPGWYMPAEHTPEPVKRGSLVALYDAGANAGRFFIALRRMPELDRRAGVFGKVMSGLEVLDHLREGDRLVRVIISMRPR